MVQAWLLGMDSSVSDTPELALPDSVELLPSRMDGGLVGEAGIGWRGDWWGHERKILS